MPVGAEKGLLKCIWIIQEIRKKKKKKKPIHPVMKQVNPTLV